jgi:nucleotide-binding universal stress UspA family protein
MAGSNSDHGPDAVQDRDQWPYGTRDRLEMVLNRTVGPIGLVRMSGKVLQMWVNPRPTGTVVVSCDSSWESQNAVVAATREASLRGTELVLLAVVEHRVYWPDSLAWLTLVEAESTQAAQAAAGRAMARVVQTDPAVAVRTVIVKELNSPELADAAREAGLLVLGRRGDGGQVAFSLGSTSAELSKRFRCPILVIHDQDRPSESQRFGPERAVVVGMEITGGASAVLPVAVTEAVIRDLPLVVVHAVSPGKDVDRTVIAEGWLSGRAALRDAQLPAGVPSRLVITQDGPVQALLDRVGPADVLVVGTRSRGRLEGLITGSVSREILDRMTCDVMVVPPGLMAAAPVPPELLDLAGRS